MAERLQKVLAGAGVASRRHAEEWIRAGRVTVNGRPATLGQRVDADDRIAVDGRRLRFEKAAPGDLVLMYHRPPGEPLRAAEASESDAAATAVYDRLPPTRGRRWLPLNPLAPSDGGLELFTTDGTLRAATGRRVHELPTGWSLRVRGAVDEALLAGLPARAAAADPPFELVEVKLAGGEGRNHWLECTVRGARGRDLRALCADAGLEVGRTLRTRLGPIALDRTIARCRHRELTARERDALYAAVGLVRERADGRERGGRVRRPPPRRPGGSAGTRSGGR